MGVSFLASETAMTQPLESIVTAVRFLSPREKLELIHLLSSDLYQGRDLEEANTSFWNLPTLDALLATQAPPVVTDLQALAVDFWPSDESADEINAFVERQRHGG